MSCVLQFGSLFAQGIQATQSTLHPGGPAARTISHLSWVVYGVFIVVSLAMWTLLAWVAIRKKGTLTEHAPVDAGGGHTWILIGGFAIPFVILSFIFVIGLQAMETFPLKMDSQSTPEIQLIGHQWWWEVNYIDGEPDKRFSTANEIHIPVGRTVDIDLVSADVIHSFWVPTLHGKEDLIPGQPNHIRIRADEPGIYRGQCAEFCGAQHAHMGLLVVADAPEDFMAWEAQQLAPATSPTTQEQIQGQQVFLGAPCALCHSIRGTQAGGGVAPDLTHIASRKTLGADTLENDTANLEAWVTHAQSLKPAAQMPDVTQFSGADLRALVAYLQNLR
jgi:cytochrome c oxidase subunit 2